MVLIWLVPCENVAVSTHVFLYTIQPRTCLCRHFIRSHVRKVDVCLAVTCTVWQNDKYILHAAGVTDTEVTVSAES